MTNGRHNAHEKYPAFPMIACDPEGFLHVHTCLFAKCSLVGYGCFFPEARAVDLAISTQRSI